MTQMGQRQSSDTVFPLYAWKLHKPDYYAGEWSWAGRQLVLAGWVTAAMVWPRGCVVVLAGARERLHSGGAFIGRRLAVALEREPRCSPNGDLRCRADPWAAHTEEMSADARNKSGHDRWNVFQ